MVTLSNCEIRTLALIVDLHIAQIKGDKETCAYVKEISNKLHELLKQNKEIIK